MYGMREVHVLISILLKILNISSKNSTNKYKIQNTLEKRSPINIYIYINTR